VSSVLTDDWWATSEGLVEAAETAAGIELTTKARLALIEMSVELIVLLTSWPGTADPLANLRRPPGARARRRLTELTLGTEGGRQHDPCRVGPRRSGPGGGTGHETGAACVGRCGRVAGRARAGRRGAAWSSERTTPPEGEDRLPAATHTGGGLSFLPSPARSTFGGGGGREPSTVRGSP
jgi:hypothetical protein